MNDDMLNGIRAYVSGIQVPDDARSRARVRLQAALSSAPLTRPAMGALPHLRLSSRFKIVAAVAASAAIIAGIALATQSSSPSSTKRNISPLGASTTTPRTASSSTLATAYPTCDTTQLRLATGSYGEEGGQYDQTFHLTNTSRLTCEMGGWPTFQVVNAAGQAEPTKTEEVRQNAPSDPPWATVVLRPRQTAAFDVYNADYDAVTNTACPNTSAALIIPPGDTGQQALSVKVTVPDCPFTYHVAPLIAGSRDDQSWSAIVG